MLIVYQALYLMSLICTLCHLRQLRTKEAKLKTLFELLQTYDRLLSQYERKKKRHDWHKEGF